MLCKEAGPPAQELPGAELWSGETCKSASCWALWFARGAASSRTRLGQVCELFQPHRKLIQRTGDCDLDRDRTASIDVKVKQTAGQGTSWALARPGHSPGAVTDPWTAKEPPPRPHAGGLWAISVTAEQGLTRESLWTNDHLSHLNGPALAVSSAGAGAACTESARRSQLQDRLGKASA